MKTPYVGKVVASWMKGRHREAGIDFGNWNFSLVAHVQKNTNVGDKFRVYIKKENTCKVSK